MIRIFHSVGQGAFYTEHFGNHVIVYDCSSQNEEVIKKNFGNFEENASK
ncbi:hypothetical protein X275_09595 [Marinitoga sp. 1197]|nr:MULTISPECIES: hypothetical protein [unclassified Marinitoga]KLO21324.1 hypothetical protein X275_09595 [Marinitoga sp. 1197]